MLCNQKGSILVEFALSCFVIMLFLFGLLGVGMWGLSAIYVKSAANEAALAYARTLDEADAIKQANKVIKNGGTIFLESSINVSATSAGHTVSATVTGHPKISRLFKFAMPSITYESKCAMEDYYRSPGAYERREGDVY